MLSSVGDTLSLVPRTVGVLLGPWKKWVVNGESNIEEAIRQIEEKMEDVPEDCFCEPAQNVVVPAIQQLSYSYDSQDLRGLYVNLLASSMDKRVYPETSCQGLFNQIHKKATKKVPEALSCS